MWWRVLAFAALAGTAAATISSVTLTTSTFIRGNSYDVTWSASVDVTSVKIELFHYSEGTVVGEVTGVTTSPFPFTVPFDVSTGSSAYRIRVVNEANPADSKTASSYITVNPVPSSFTFTYPTSSSTVGTRGSSMNIGWTTVGEIYTVDIQECTATAPIVCTTVASNVTNQGAFLWQLPADLRNGQHRLTISGNTFHPKHDRVDKTQPFTVQAAVSSLTFTYPTSSSTVAYRGSSMNIGWTTVGDIYTVDIEACTSLSPEVCITVASNVTNQGSFLWQLPANLRAAQHKFTISSNTFHPKHDSVEKTQAFTVQVAPSSLTVKQPTANANWIRGEKYTIEWESTGGIDSVDIKICNSAETDCTNVATDAANIWTFLWTVPETHQTVSQKIVISTNRIDPAGEPKTAKSSLFYVRAAETKLEVTTPSGSSNSPRVYRGMPYSITWTRSGPIDSVDLIYYPYRDLPQDGVVIVSDTPNDGEYTWQVPNDLPLSAFHRLHIRANRYSPAADPKPADGTSFYFYAMPTSLALITPATSTSRHAYRGTTVNITWATTGPITALNIEYKYGTNDYQVIVSNTPNRGFYLWAVPKELPIATHRMRLTPTQAHPAADPQPVESSFYVSDVPSSSSSGGDGGGAAAGAIFAVGAVMALGVYARAAIMAKRKKRLEKTAERQAKMAAGKAEASHPYTEEGIPACYFPGYQPPAPEIAPISPQAPRLQQTGPDMA